MVSVATPTLPGQGMGGYPSAISTSYGTGMYNIYTVYTVHSFLMFPITQAHYLQLHYYVYVSLV